MSDGHRQRCVSLCEDDEVEGPNILTVVERDPAAADFLISIFMAALNSYAALPLPHRPPPFFKDSCSLLPTNVLHSQPSNVPNDHVLSLTCRYNHTTPHHTTPKSLCFTRLVLIKIRTWQRYRSTTLVKPFPKRFRKDPPPGVAEREGSDEFNDFDRLRACAAAIPPVDQIIKSNASENDGSRPSSATTPPLDEECSGLLRWVIQNRKFRVVTHATTMYE